MSAFRRMSDMMRLAITRFYSVFPANSGTVLSSKPQGLNYGTVLSNKPQGLMPFPNHLCAAGSAKAGL